MYIFRSSLRGRVEKLCVFPDDVDDVEAETVHAATAPKVDDVDIRPAPPIVPVQIGLGEIVKVKVVSPVSPKGAHAGPPNLETQLVGRELSAFGGRM